MKNGTIQLSAQLMYSLPCEVGGKSIFRPTDESHPFCLSQTKFIAAFVRNNDLFSTLAASRLGLKMSLFLTQAAMNFVLERRNGRKRYSHDFEYQKL